MRDEDARMERQDNEDCEFCDREGVPVVVLGRPYEHAYACGECLLRALALLDDRPRPVPFGEEC